MSNSATRVCDIALISRDNMNMKMWDGLSRCGANIYSNVKAVRLVPGFDRLFRDLYSFNEANLLLVGRIEPGSHMPSWNYKRMSRGHWIPIPETKNMRIVLIENPCLV